MRQFQLSIRPRCLKNRGQESQKFVSCETCQEHVSSIDKNGIAEIKGCIVWCTKHRVLLHRDHAFLPFKKQKRIDCTFCDQLRRKSAPNDSSNCFTMSNQRFDSYFSMIFRTTSFQNLFTFIIEAINTNSVKCSILVTVFTRRYIYT